MRYFSNTTKGFYDSDLHSKDQIPSDAAVISEEVYDNLLKGQFEGGTIRFIGESPSVHNPSSTLKEAVIERAWRNGELFAADVELNKVQDSDPKAVGSVSDWRAYRKALRAWPEHKNFPNKTFRPISPLIAGA